MLPFASFPHGGRRLLGRPKMGNGSSRSGYGLSLRTMTHQTVCAYCGLDLFGDYHRWLLLQVDHVVPTGVARALQIPTDLYEDAINLVLACAGCNGFDNRYTYKFDVPELWTVDIFADLRDIVFAERANRIEVRRAYELEIFAKAPWS